MLTRRAFAAAAVGALPAAAAPAVKAATPLRGAKPAGPLVILDPGHGGRDPGAIGVSGTYEKHVAFAAARELARQLQGRGVRVALTRNRDQFIPLEERVGTAERRGAALFMSLHADALTDHGVRGASVYTLGDTASDAQSAALARRENAADRFIGAQFRDTPPDIARILSSLVRRETRIGSAKMARGVISALGPSVPLLTNPVRQAGFVVLKASDIPSVLVEMGFMSNRQDEAALRTPAHVAKVAGALQRAVLGYLASAGAPSADPPQRFAG